MKPGFITNVRFRIEFLRFQSPSDPFTAYEALSDWMRRIKDKLRFNKNFYSILDNPAFYGTVNSTTTFRVRLAYDLPHDNNYIRSILEQAARFAPVLVRWLVGHTARKCRRIRVYAEILFQIPGGNTTTYADTLLFDSERPLTGRRLHDTIHFHSYKP
jgi:hypothetical protein